MRTLKTIYLLIIIGVIFSCKPEVITPRQMLIKSYMDITKYDTTVYLFEYDELGRIVKKTGSNSRSEYLWSDTCVELFHYTINVNNYSSYYQYLINDEGTCYLRIIPQSFPGDTIYTEYEYDESGYLIRSITENESYSYETIYTINNENIIKIQYNSNGSEGMETSNFERKFYDLERPQNYVTNGINYLGKHSKNLTSEFKSVEANRVYKQSYIFDDYGNVKETMVLEYQEDTLASIIKTKYFYEFRY